MKKKLSINLFAVLMASLFILGCDKKNDSQLSTKKEISADLKSNAGLTSILSGQYNIQCSDPKNQKFLAPALCLLGLPCGVSLESLVAVKKPWELIYSEQDSSYFIANGKNHITALNELQILNGFNVLLNLLKLGDNKDQLWRIVSKPAEDASKWLCIIINVKTNKVLMPSVLGSILEQGEVYDQAKHLLEEGQPFVWNFIKI